MEKNYLIFDMGTGNSKVALVSSRGKIIGIKTTGNCYCRDDLYPDAQYFAPAEWEKKLLGLADALIRENPSIRIDGISASGARQSVVLYDTKGNAFLGLPNIDNRGREWMHEIDDKDDIYHHTGKWVTEDFIAAKIMGFGKRHPEDFARISGITSLSEWIGEIFCGKIVMESSQACETQIFDIIDMQWSEQLSKKYGISVSILPEIQCAGTSLGKIKPEIAKRFGLSQEVPFIIGGADTQLAAKGSRAEEDEIVVVSGTTTPVVRVKKTIYHDTEQRCWTDCNLGGHNFLIETNPGVTGLNFQRFKDAFLSDISYATLDSELEKKYLKKEEQSYTASFTSLLFSKQKSLKVGGFVLPAPFPSDCTCMDLAYAILADIACATYKQYLSLCEMVPFEKDFIRGCGGGLKSPVLCQLLSDLTGKKLILSDGFTQASIAGCVDVCNEYYHISSDDKSDFKAYEPKNTEYMKKYYTKWNSNRMLLNA